ncbi:hypothetical protein GALMADRAFT_145271 [Galerina marginata CBS 339.88]|uniref:Uncharacterized protein n=1 Tax=Galerina marginata (strain CBS 339.88) TaxID=685588 RepID=A0A067SIS1_GALM3|nr:hypothetical protein GALMADRAFT_145271 [Galerina marginata CBS 339.88]
MLNEALSTIGNITLENSLSANMDVEPELSTIGNMENSLSANMDVEPELSTIGNMENSLSANMDVEPELSTIGNMENSLSANMDVEPELINDRSLEAPALSESGGVQVRTFRNRKDFLSQSSIKYPRRHDEGINVQDLGKRLNPAGLYESDCLMKLVDPFNFKPVYIPDMYIDPVVIDMHIKRQGYLRLVLIQEW